MSRYEAKFFVVNPDSIEMELTIRMSLADWKKLKSQLSSSSFSSWQVGSTIHDMVMKADRHFKSDSEGLPVV